MFTQMDRGMDTWTDVWMDGWIEVWTELTNATQKPQCSSLLPYSHHVMCPSGLGHRAPTQSQEGSKVNAFSRWVSLDVLSYQADTS